MKNIADVTVITASYNSQKYLRETVESVANQTLMPREHLIIDDCSTDDSLALAKQLEKEFSHVRVIEHEQNKGFPAALNTGIEAAQSKYIGILDSDDIALTYWLEETTKILDSDSSIGLVGGGCIIMTEKGELTGHIKWCEVAGDVTSQLQNGEYLMLHPGTVHRTSILNSIGNYREDLKSLEDNDMYINVSNNSKVFHLGIPLINYRRLPYSESRKTPQFKTLMMEYLTKKTELLSKGLSVKQTNANLKDITDRLQKVTRLEPLHKGTYEREMADFFWGGCKHKRALAYYFKAYKKGYSFHKILKALIKKIISMKTYQCYWGHLK